MNTRGLDAEQKAVDYLTHLGFKVITRNFLARGGELDIVAFEADTLCFIEVKSRHSTTFGFPYEAVTHSKQKHIALAAQVYLQKHFSGKVPACRFDVISLIPDSDPFLIRNAFSVQSR